MAVPHEGRRMQAVDDVDESLVELGARQRPAGDAGFLDAAPLAAELLALLGREAGKEVVE